jgi:FMN-dependent oxidoreductase (nitrilotriacetate monooxygenase family)
LPLDEFARDLEITRLAEQAKLDAVFTADFVSMINLDRSVFLEPLTLMSGLAAATERIGLVATVSTTYFEAYNLARQFASLDRISGGRAGWNLVTSINANAALQFGTVHPPHAERYKRAEEYVEVVVKLWDSWEDDALVADRDRGVYVDPEKVHEINHEGQYLKVAGPLNVQRSPQGHPVIVQAGSSAAGITFAARYAEAVFTALHSLEVARDYYADLKGQMARFGRRPEDLLVLPGLQPIIGDTESKARELHSELLEYSNEQANLRMLQSMLGGVDLSDFPLDEPLFPRFEVEYTDVMSHQRIDLIADLARRENLTVRQLISWIAAGHGHRVIVGTPEQVADDIEAWFLGHGVDGSRSSRRTSQVALRRSRSRSFHCSRHAGCSAPTTSARRCASTTGSSVRSVSTHARARRQSRRWQRPRPRVRRRWLRTARPRPRASSGRSRRSALAAWWSSLTTRVARTRVT